MGQAEGKDGVGETTATIDETARGLMLHALGLTPNLGKTARWAKRNAYCAEVVSAEYGAWAALVGKGLANEGSHVNRGADRYFHVNKAGIEALGADISSRVPMDYRYAVLTPTTGDRMVYLASDGTATP